MHDFDDAFKLVMHDSVHPCYPHHLSRDNPPVVQFSSASSEGNIFHWLKPISPVNFPSDSDPKMTRTPYKIIWQPNIFTKRPQSTSRLINFPKLWSKVASSNSFNKYIGKTELRSRNKMQRLPFLPRLSHCSLVAADPGDTMSPNRQSLGQGLLAGETRDWLHFSPQLISLNALSFQKPLSGKIRCQSLCLLSVRSQWQRSSGLAGGILSPLVKFRPEWEVKISSLMEKGRGRERGVSPLPQISPLKLPSIFSQWSKPIFLPFSGQGQRYWGWARGDSWSLLISGLRKGMSFWGGIVRASQRLTGSL